MSSRIVQRWLTVGAILMLPVLAQAQEATLSGKLTDTTGGALPGATVQAVHEASGNSFETITDERGDYRLALRVGTYRLALALAGFAPATRTITVLVGQAAVVNLQMSVSGLQESVTVTGEAPLLDVTESSLGGNIDPRQLEAYRESRRAFSLRVRGSSHGTTESIFSGAARAGDPVGAGACGGASVAVGGD